MVPMRRKDMVGLVGCGVKVGAYKCLAQSGLRLVLWGFIAFLSGT